VAAPIEKRGGVINQFQGDAILASFNLPEADPDHAGKAIEAALEIQQVLAGHTFASGIKLRSRVGINSGEVVGGLVGTAERVNYTVHGDDVNLAARLEQLNKEHNTRILVSERTLELAGRERFKCRRIGTVATRGRQAPTVIYALEA
jgi:adenylate cyclase